MTAHHRHTLKLSAIMLAIYALATAALILINHETSAWLPDLAAPAYWLIWLFAYWPIALAAFACIAITHPSRKITLIFHIAYITLTLMVMQLSLSFDTNWPLVILKITGLVFAFTCITALPRKAAN